MELEAHMYMIFYYCPATYPPIDFLYLLCISVVMYRLIKKDGRDLKPL